MLPPIPPLTDDGIHLNGYGYRRAAEIIAMGLNWEAHWAASRTWSGDHPAAAALATVGAAGRAGEAK